MGLFSSPESKKILSKEKTIKLFSNPTLRYHFVEEKKAPPNLSVFSPTLDIKAMTGELDTGKFHLIIKVNAPENLTGISTSSETIFQEWELIKVVNFKRAGDGYYLFKAWGRTPCVANEFIDNSHHEGKELFIDREYFENNIIGAMYMSDNFDDQTLFNTIGFEMVKFG